MLKENRMASNITKLNTFKSIVYLFLNVKNSESSTSTDTKILV